MANVANTPAWKELEAHAGSLRATRIADLFAADPSRPTRFACEAAGLFVDYSKQLAIEQTLERLLQLAQQCGVAAGIARMFAGETINPTEGRAALHVALRNVSGRRMPVAGKDVMPDVLGVVERMGQFADRVRSGDWKGQTGARITDVVNIGIGGSDLGPRMVCAALAPFADGPRTHFVSNVDGEQLHALIQGLDPAATLFVVTSKTFTTQETMANAAAARAWVAKALGDAAVPRHFVAVSTNRDAVAKFGIGAANVFEFWDWVGGRYSLWSSVGLSIVVALGPQRFRELLAGAHAMDEHFRSAPLRANAPVICGLLGVWNNNFLRAASHVIAPYAQRLDRFVDWLQQLEMESNGKRIDRDGNPVSYATTPALWGGVGTNAQHAFFQMLHQSASTHSVDFILVGKLDGGEAQHRMLLANGLAQSAAMMKGHADDNPHAQCPGNRPTTTILLPRLDPCHLGALLALYEHRTYVQSLLWNVNAFDQFGVELGKRMARDVLAALDGGADAALDGSTRGLLGRLRNL